MEPANVFLAWLSFKIFARDAPPTNPISPNTMPADVQLDILLFKDNASLLSVDWMKFILSPLKNVSAPSDIIVSTELAHNAKWTKFMTQSSKTAHPLWLQSADSMNIGSKIAASAKEDTLKSVESVLFAQLTPPTIGPQIAAFVTMDIISLVSKWCNCPTNTMTPEVPSMIILASLTLIRAHTAEEPRLTNPQLLLAATTTNQE